MSDGNDLEEVPFGTLGEREQAKVAREKSEPRDPFEEQKQQKVFRADDIGNGERLVSNYGNMIRWCQKAGGWFYYDGTRWQRDDLNNIEKYAKETAREMIKIAYFEPDQETRVAAAKWAAQSQERYRITTMIKNAASEEGIPIRYEDLDSDPYLFNLLNGTYDLRTNNFRPHNAQDLITKVSAVNYDEQAECPKFEEFMDKVTDCRPDLAAYIQTLFGYALYGDFRMKVFPVFYGPPDTGKSTLFELLGQVFGDYHHAADISAFDMKKYTGGHTDEIAAMRGARLITVVEPSEYFKLNISLIKKITGGDSFSASHKNEKTFKMKIVGLVCLNTNHRVFVPPSDDAAWKRIKEIPFDYTIPDEIQDEQYVKVLFEEASGIFNWILKGWQRYIELPGRLIAPEIVTTATIDFRSSQDRVQMFIDDCCRTDVENIIKSSDLHRVYSRWAKANNYWVLSNRGLTQALQDKGFVLQKRGTGNFWLGVVIQDDWKGYAEWDSKK